MLYRLFTENKNIKGIEKKCNKYFKGFTIIKAVGYWQGVSEKSLIIEVITRKLRDVNKLANDIKVLNKQEAVLVEKISNQDYLI